MAELIASRSVRLNSQNPRLQSPTVNLDRLTSAITVKLRRPTTAQPLNWNANSTVRVSLVFIVDGVEYRCVGHVTGGFRYADPPLNTIAIPEYRLTYNPTVLFSDKAREYIKTATPDRDGFYNDVPLTRLGELGSTVQGYLLLERVRGTINTVVTVAATMEAPAPTVRTKNSVAFDAVSQADETAGDGVLSVSHTSSGSNRAVFAGSSNSFGAAHTSASMTYGGTGMTEMWDLDFNVFGNAGYRLAGQATGVQTVTSTLDANDVADHALGVVSMTGVDQTSPVGTPASATGSSGTASVTVGSVGADDLVVDQVVWNASTPTIGADQTQRYSVDGGGGFLITRGSTQPGTAGGVMSWTASSSDWGIGAVAFKPAAGKGPPLSRPMLHMLVR